MITLASTVAALLYLLPVAVVWAACSRRDAEPWEYALAVPFAVAVDLLGILLLARFLRLEQAAVVSRAGWALAALALGVAVATRRRPRPALPAWLSARDLVAVATAGGLALLISLDISRPCSIWDRIWHTPLVASMRGQSIPFTNVYGGDLHYHHAGDALAAVLQTLSGGVLHASLALSVAHDVVFALLGVSVALLFRSFGVKGAAPVVAVLLCVLLGGPGTLLITGKARPESGHSILSFMQMSFRPHASLAALLFVGFVGAVLVRVRPGSAGVPARRTLGALLASAALLAVTDEASLGLLGLSLGLTWIVAPEVIHPRRGVGVAVFGALLAALILPNLVLAGALAPGGQKHHLAVVPWRSPGYVEKAAALTSPEGRRMLVHDLLPAASLAAGAALLALRSRRREVRVAACFLGALLAVSALGLTRVDFDGVPSESHRFAVAVVFVAPLVALALVAWTRGAPGFTRGMGGAALALVAGGALLGAASTFDYVSNVLPLVCDKHTRFHTQDNLYAVDCRRDAGARFGERPRPTYVEDGLWYLYAGCRPIFAPVTVREWWDMKIGSPQLGRPAFAALHAEWVRADEPLDVVCAKESADPICVKALASPSCQVVGTRAVRCSLTAAEREAILR